MSLNFRGDRIFSLKGRIGPNEIQEVLNYIGLMSECQQYKRFVCPVCNNDELIEKENMTKAIRFICAECSSSILIPAKLLKGCVKVKAKGIFHFE